MSLCLRQMENVSQAAKVRRRCQGYQYKRKCNFIYTHKKSMTFPVPIFTKLMKTKQCYAEIPYTNWTTSIQHTNINSRMSIHKLWLSLHMFSWNLLSWNKFLWTTPALNFIQITQKYRKNDKFSFTAQSKECVPLHWFSQNSSSNIHFL